MKKQNEFKFSALSSRCQRVLTGTSLPTIPNLSYRGQEERIPSRVTKGGDTAAKESKVYTGTSMVGVATMHKSNAVPVFDSEHAKEVSSMRR